MIYISGIRLPKITTSGKNTFGCPVNGRDFSDLCSSGDGFTCESPAVRLNPNPGEELEIRGVNGREINSISGDTAYAGVNHAYPVRFGSGGLHVRYSQNILRSRVDIYYTDSAVWCQGELCFTTLDKQRRIVSGSFWFDAWKPGMDTVRVLEGWFDCRFIFQCPEGTKVISPGTKSPAPPRLGFSLAPNSKKTQPLPPPKRPL